MSIRCINHTFHEENKCHLYNECKSLQKLIQRKNFFVEGDFCEIEKYVYDAIKNKNGLIKQIINLMFEAEFKSAGSFEELLNLVAHQIFSLEKKDIKIYASLKQDDISYLYQQFAIDANLQSILNDLVECAGFNGKIIVERGNRTETVIEKQNGCSFTLQSLDQHYVGKYRNAQVCLIDGFVESVAEINQLFESFNQSGETLIMFHRGLAEEVIQTLSVNWLRGTLRIIPVLVPFDLKGMNMLNDIAAVAVTDVISCLKGQLISSISISDCQLVDFVEILKNKVTIVKKGNEEKVSSHVSCLIKKRNESIDDVADVYNERIKSLSTNLVLLKLRDDISYLKKRQKVDKFLRGYRNLLDDGLVEYNGKKMLYSTFKIVEAYLNIIKSQINEIGCVLETIEIKEDKK